MIQFLKNLWNSRKIRLTKSKDRLTLLMSELRTNSGNWCLMIDLSGYYLDSPCGEHSIHVDPYRGVAYEIDDDVLCSRHEREFYIFLTPLLDRHKDSRWKSINIRT